MNVNGLKRFRSNSRKRKPAKRGFSRDEKKRLHKEFIEYQKGIPFGDAFRGTQPPFRRPEARRTNGKIEYLCPCGKTIKSSVPLTDDRLTQLCAEKCNTFLKLGRAQRGAGPTLEIRKYRG